MLKDGEEVPELFEDPVMKRASHWVLSTSALVSQHLREYGWGEVGVWPNVRVLFSTEQGCQVVPNGFGVAYLTCNDGAS